MPEENDPIAVFVHLSDLHIWAGQNRVRLFRRDPFKAAFRILGGTLCQLRGLEPHSPTILKHLAVDLKRDEFPKIDALLVTGDVTNLGDGGSFQEAYRYFTGPISDDCLGFPSQGVFVVPGNHDTITDKYLRSLPRLSSYTNSFFQKCHTPFYAEEKIVSNGANTKKFLIFGFDSTRAEPKHFSDGRIGDQLVRFRDKIMELKQSNRIDEYFKIVLLHHHPLPIAGTAPNYWTQLIDAASLMPVLQQGKIDMVIHGHEHLASISQVNYFINSGKPMVVCAAGTASQKDTGPGCSFNSYHFFEDHYEIKIWQFTRNVMWECISTQNILYV